MIDTDQRQGIIRDAEAIHGTQNDRPPTPPQPREPDERIQDGGERTGPADSPTDHITENRI